MGGDRRRGNTQVSCSQRSHRTSGSKSPARHRAHCSTPTRFQAGDLVGKYGGDRRRGNTQVSCSQRSHGTPGSKSPARRRAHRSTPTRSQAGDLVGKYGVQASATDLEALPLGPNPPPGDYTLGSSVPHSPPWSESERPVERPSSSDTSHSAQLATKGSVQQSPVDPPVQSEHVPVTPGPGKPGSGQLTGTRCPVSPTTPGSPGAPVTLGSPVTPGASVRPVYTGQNSLHWSESSKGKGRPVPGPV